MARPVVNIEESVKRLQSAWGTPHMWRVMHEVSSAVRSNPDAFKVFLGKTGTFYICEDDLTSAKQYDDTNGSNDYNYKPASVYGDYEAKLVSLLDYERADSSTKAAFTFETSGCPSPATYYAHIDPFSCYGFTSEVTGVKVTSSNYVDLLFEDDIAEYIPTVKVPYGAYGGNPVSNASLKTFAPSAVELFGQKGLLTWGPSGSQFMFYKENASASHIKKIIKTTSAVAYALRDNKSNATEITYSGNYAMVDKTGALIEGNVYGSSGGAGGTSHNYSFCFCID